MGGWKMKRYNNLFDDMLTYEKILKVYKKIKGNIRNKKSVIKFDANLNQNLLEIVRLLYEGKYEFNRYNIFLIREPKYRLIMSERIEDKIVNHMVSEYILLPTLERSLIDTNVATRKGKGSSYAFNNLVKYINEVKGKDVYFLKIDISKYFYNIDHDILNDLLNKKIKDKKSIRIIRNILDTTNEKYINDKISEVIQDEINQIKHFKINDNEKMDRLKE